MELKNPHLGSSFNDWLEEESIREEVTTAAIKSVIALKLAEEMKAKKISKKHMAEMMQTSRAQIDRILDPNNGSASTHTPGRLPSAECVSRCHAPRKSTPVSTSTSM